MEKDLHSRIPTPDNNDPRELARARGDGLAAIPEESVWLANFVSPQTRRAYRVAVGAFIRFHGFEAQEELRAIDPAHLIAWRATPPSCTPSSTPAAGSRR